MPLLAFATDLLLEEKHNKFGASPIPWKFFDNV
jgi:hypothetical protein